MTDGRISSIHALRGIAVLAVCAIHFLDSHNGGDLPNVVREIAKYGFHGVTLFFVISGFVLPLALTRAGYAVSDFPQFALKRALRLEPPYLVAVVVVSILKVAASAAPGFNGPPYAVDWIGLALHVGYLVPLFDKPWLVGVFWSLLIEVQFYVLIGLTYPIFKRYPAMWIIALAAPSAWITNWHALTFHLPVFLIGTTAFAWWNRSLSSSTAALIAIGLAAYLTGYRGPDFAISAIGAAAFILWTNPTSRILVFFGTISYSLYLVHVPIGSKTINLLLRFMPQHPLLCAAIALILAVCMAWLMWRYVEKPSMGLAAKIKYAAQRALDAQRSTPPDAVTSRP